MESLPRDRMAFRDKNLDFRRDRTFAPSSFIADESRGEEMSSVDMQRVHVLLAAAARKSRRQHPEEESRGARARARERERETDRRSDAHRA
jgi:hypothetical protein